ncbi:MAG: hypothetical protein ABIO21_18860 [Pseudomonas sp.]
MFLEDRAALAATVVVQPFKINGGVRSFFLLKIVINAGVQENNDQIISMAVTKTVGNWLLLMDKKYSGVTLFFGQAADSTRAQ